MECSKILSSPLLTLLYPLPHIILATYIAPLLPYSSLAFGVSAYASYSIFATFLGLAGLRLRLPTLLHYFSYHLIIDVVLSLVPQITLLILFHDYTSNSEVCSTNYYGTKSYTKFRVPKLEKALSLEDLSWCGFWLQAMQVVAGTLIVVSGVAQWRAAMEVRRLAIWHQKNPEFLEEEVAVSDEKQGLLIAMEGRCRSPFKTSH